MSHREHLHHLMTELGPLLEPLEITEFEELNTWTVVMDEDTTLFVDYDEDNDRLTLSADVGTPAEDIRGRIYRQLLRRNGEALRPGQARLALDEAGGTVVQIVDLPQSNPDVAGLQGAIREFLDTLSEWREAVNTSSHASAVPMENFSPGGMIRG